MKMDQTEKLILEAIDQHRDEIIEFARDIYDHGELGYKEFNTAEKFIKKMKELGLRTETGLADSNVGIEDGIYTFPYFCTFLLKRYLREKDEEKIV